MNSELLFGNREELDLRAAAISVAEWRLTKTGKSQKMPISLQKSICKLAQKYPITKIAKHLGIQLSSIRRAIGAIENHDTSKAASNKNIKALEFVDVTSAMRSPLGTGGIELCRPDGFRLLLPKDSDLQEVLFHFFSGCGR